MTNSARIDGNIQADGGESVIVSGGTTVNGDIQFENLYGQASEVTDSTILGNLQLKSNQVDLLAANTVIDGDLQAYINFGELTILGNWIDGNLQCKSNSPPPRGGANLVSGNKEDRCAALSQTAGGSGSGSSPEISGELVATGIAWTQSSPADYSYSGARYYRVSDDDDWDEDDDDDDDDDEDEDDD